MFLVTKASLVFLKYPIVLNMEIKVTMTTVFTGPLMNWNISLYLIASDIHRSKISFQAQTISAASFRLSDALNFEFSTTIIQRL